MMATSFAETSNNKLLLKELFNFILNLNFDHDYIIKQDKIHIHLHLASSNFENPNISNCNMVSTSG